MSEYIEREFALNVLCRENCGHDYEVNKCNNCYTSNFINYLPTADVAEVKHGKWIKCSVIKCSVCGSCTDIQSDEAYEKFIESYYYCPVCGSKLDLED